MFVFGKKNKIPKNSLYIIENILYILMWCVCIEITHFDDKISHT